MLIIRSKLLFAKNEYIFTSWPKYFFCMRRTLCNEKFQSDGSDGNQSSSVTSQFSSKLFPSHGSLSHTNKTANLTPQEDCQNTSKNLISTIKNRDQIQTNISDYDELNNNEIDNNNNSTSITKTDEFIFQEKAFQSGEFAFICHQEGKQSCFTKLFKLNMTSKFNSPYGIIENRDIIGCLSGKKFKTSQKKYLTIQRPSLRDYVLHMKHKATVLNPETAHWTTLITDISPGDTVLEAGSGSGGLTLFLSKCVGPSGHVFSFEVREDHLEISKSNYNNWKASYNLSHQHDWPDNVSFHLADVYDEVIVKRILKRWLLDAICLDMVNALPALPAVAPSVKQGKCLSVYYPHLTQIIQLHTYIEENNLPFQVEDIYEIMPRKWLIRKVTEEYAMAQESDNKEEEIHSDISFMCKPEMISNSYSAFLVKIRKIEKKT